MRLQIASASLPLRGVSLPIVLQSGAEPPILIPAAWKEVASASKGGEGRDAPGDRARHSPSVYFSQKNSLFRGRPHVNLLTPNRIEPSGRRQTRRSRDQARASDHTWLACSI